MTESASKVRTCLWFDGDGADAAALYVSLLPNSRIEIDPLSAPGASPLVVAFTLAGAPFMALNGGPMYHHSPASSIIVLTKDQAETDRLWQGLIADGGAESRCGWLTDRFGVSWQIVPEILPRLLSDPDAAAAGRAREAMLAMKKIDIAALLAAHSGH
jgi:predicted 3-demethylubiquinone-9 3-methyltransferase (glyoxalase superfamily)